MALLGIFILNSTTDVRVANAYIYALAIADVGHVGASAVVMGWDRVLDVGGWNAIAWGNVGITVGLFVVRGLYLGGAFGRSKGTGMVKGKTL